MNKKELLYALEEVLVDMAGTNYEINIKCIKGDYSAPKVKVLKRPTNNGYYNSKNRRK